MSRMAGPAGALALSLAIAGAASGALPGAAASEPETVTVGCMYPMTGRGALYGRDSVAAIEMAVEEVNSKGGAAGKRIEVQFADSQSKPAFAVRIARRFISEEGVDFLCGAVSSAVGLAVSEVALANRTIFIGTDHASSRLTIENWHPYYFRVSNNTYQSMAAGALHLQSLKATHPWQTIAFIGPDYEYGRTMWADLRSRLDALGVSYEIAGEFWPKLYEPDFTPYVMALQRAEPDVIVNGHWGGDFVAFLRQSKALDLFADRIVANFDAGGNYEVMATLRDDMTLGLVLSARHHNNWPDTERNRSFVERFHARTGRYPSYAAHGAYAGIKFITAAVETVGNATDREALIEALRGMRIALPKDPDGFESYIDPLSHQIVQTQAIGVVVPDDRYPPATTMLGDWVIYEAEKLMPSVAEVEQRRRAQADAGVLAPPNETGVSAN